MVENGVVWGSQDRDTACHVFCNHKHKSYPVQDVSTTLCCTCKAYLQHNVVDRSRLDHPVQGIHGCPVLEMYRVAPMFVTVQRS